MHFIIHCFYIVSVKNFFTAFVGTGCKILDIIAKGMDIMPFVSPTFRVGIYREYAAFQGALNILFEAGEVSRLVKPKPR
jgi:hypothetical protein